MAALLVAGAWEPGWATEAQAQAPRGPDAEDAGDAEDGEDAEDAEDGEDAGDAEDAEDADRLELEWTGGDDEDESPAEAPEGSEPAEAPEVLESEEAPGDPEGGDAAPGEALGGVTTRFGPAPAAPRAEGDSRLLIPPLYLDRTGDVSTRAVFPLYYERDAPDDHQLLIGPYYRRRGLELNADVVFPFFWSFRTVGSTTVAVPPFYHHDDEDGFDWGLAPFVFDGRSGDDVYTVIPPLLTASVASEERAFTIAGPFWRVREGEAVRWGLFPLVWTYDDQVASSTIAAPFFFRFADTDEGSATTVVPPVYHHEDAEGALYGVGGLFHHYHDRSGSSLTIPPLVFHYSRFGEDTRLVTPLFGYFDVEGASTLVTPLYQRHRGDTELDAVAPFFFSVRNPQQHTHAVVVPPLVWHFGGPASETTLVLPLFGRWHERGRYTTWATPLVAHYESHEEASAGTWIFPTFQASHTPESTTFNVHPLLYATSARTHRHFVLAPLYWDFEDYEDDTRATVLFPLFWRFRDGSSVHQLAGNTYYHHYREGGVPGWEFHFFPLFAYGEPRPGDHFWYVLFGLAGYRRQGSYARASAFWIPFQVDGPEGGAEAAVRARP